MEKQKKLKNDSMDSKSNSERYTIRPEQIQSSSMWETMGQDSSFSYVFTQRPIRSRRAEVVYHANIPSRKDDCISYSASNVSGVYWSKAQ